MTAPTGLDNADIPGEDDAVARATALLDDDQILDALTYVGDSEYAHIYLSTWRGQHEGNTMLFVGYIWLSREGAYQDDKVGSNVLRVRLVDGLPSKMAGMVAAAANRSDAGVTDPDVQYHEL